MASDVVREGVFAINKPRGQSSAQIIRDCQTHFNPSAFFKPLIDAEVQKRIQESRLARKQPKAKLLRKANQVKVGHGGTLDPLATGVLILGVGSATKQLPQFLECTKTYETVVLFGVSTDTYDRCGRILTKRSYDHVTREKVEKALESFRGKQVQIPPLYSALKMNGKPLYEYAREGKPIPRQIEGREVEATEVELVEWYEPGKHEHRWPTEEAEAAERNLAEQVWRVKRQQENAKVLTAEEKEEDDQAIEAHESFKRLFEERQDELVRDSPSRRVRLHKEPPLMSGALGKMPEPAYSTRGRNLVPESSAENTPPPWSDEGPPAAKIRLTVTSGYYVRSFCHDLGGKVGSAALMAELCRTRQSDFTVGGPNCLEYDDLAKGEQVWGPQVADMLARWNGEPEGNWSVVAPSAAPPDTDGSPKKRMGDVNHSPRKGEKRQRRSRSRGASSSPEPPRKALARINEMGERPPRLAATSSRERSDDEKSWNGIEDKNEDGADTKFANAPTGRRR